ncbi:general transcription factor 3C polypeptide 1 [Pelobates cultripes]|uniref:General transcription factor 3C polypeptide 1 n=1 Tax=Pelobates cultripes TaxID=61616 RepID=A0AAD1SRB2_PELCU|nr:general transcription factor 3C polypeptide 1 [Pelobates cultripes]
MTMDVLEALLEEVALEGLDGITLSALWLRLQTRLPPFPLSLDSKTKQLIWQSLASHPELEFYLLPKERGNLVLYDRYEENDDDMVVVKSKNVFCTEDIYPVHMITNNKKGIQGSCQFFKERSLVTEQVRIPSQTYEEAVAKWGEKLVIVGSQVLRKRTLIGWEGDPSLEIPDYSYCILEKIGRSRWQGELQKDLQVVFKVDAGKIHYLRRPLDKNALITMQSHVIKLSNGIQQHSLLLLLKKFHVDRRNKYDILTEKVTAKLSECNNQIETLLTIRENLSINERNFKRLYHYMANAGIVKIISMPLHEMHPFAGPFKTKKGTDVMVRCMKLIKESKRKHEDSDDDDDDDEELKTPVLPVDIIYEKDILTQAYELVENCGTKGLSQSEIRVAMNVGKLEARMLCRLLERYRLIKGFMEDEGRQRTTKYISHVFVEESDLRRQFLEEKAKSEKLSMCTFSPTQKKVSIKASLQHNESLEVAHQEERDVEKGSKILNTVETYSSASHLSSTSRLKAMPKVNARPFLSKDADKLLSENYCSRDGFQMESNLSTLSADEDERSVIEEILEKSLEHNSTEPCKKKTSEKCRETYRLLKRRNIIVEAVKNLRLVESLFMLQKMIMEQEKQEGVSTKCCKKSIMRLVQRLSQEGLVRLYRTNVVQDGISKKVEFVVHPSINPNDPLVRSSIEQIRFRMSNTTSSNRSRSPQGSLNSNKQETEDQSKGRAKEKNPKTLPYKNNFPGLGRTLGYLPKMPRLKTTHIFLWYIIYGHPLRKLQEHHSDGNVVSSEAAGSKPETLLPSITHVYVDDTSWIRYVPPATIHSEFGHGWVLVSDILLCLPLSIFVQIVQVSYKVENLEVFLNHPIKKHTLIRYLPRSIRQQLLYKRRYVFSVFQGLQKLSYMGLLQFGPTEKFQEKDQNRLRWVHSEPFDFRFNSPRHSSHMVLLRSKFSLLRPQPHTAADHCTLPLSVLLLSVAVLSFRCSRPQIFHNLFRHQLPSHPAILTTLSVTHSIHTCFRVLLQGLKTVSLTKRVPFTPHSASRLAFVHMNRFIYKRSFILTFQFRVPFGTSHHACVLTILALTLRRWSASRSFDKRTDCFNHTFTIHAVAYYDP